MKLAAMIGSLRKESFNRKAFLQYEKLSKNTFQFEEIRIDSLPLYNADIQAKGFPKDVLQIGEILRQVEGIIFFTPEYNYSVPGALKNAIDWVSRLDEQPFDNLPATVIGASIGRLGTSRAQYHLRQIGVFVNLIFLNKPEVMIATAQSIFDESGNILDKNTTQVMQKHIEAFKDFIIKTKSFRSKST